MNERIQELFEQALEEFNAGPVFAAYIIPDPIKEKFAQLIVLECEKVAKNPEWYSESPSNGWRNPIRFVCNTFKEHFGVEE